MSQTLQQLLPARFRPGIVDAALALVLAAGALAEMVLSDVDAPAEARVAGAFLTTLPLAWRTVAPVTAVAFSSAGFALGVLLGLPADETLLPLLAPFVALYSAGVHSSFSGLAGAAAAFLAATVLVSLHDGDASNLPMQVAGLAAALAVGRAVRIMGFESETLEARAAELERERDEKARLAVAEERARIARELHDVIGHSISVMGVQAGAVRRLLRPEQEREREALLAVERTGRDAVDEMRRLLGFLREDSPEAPLGPLPTLALVDELVADMRKAGLEVEVCVDGALETLPPGRALAAFRILQEALTNVLKHAPGAHVRATLLETSQELQVKVVDDGGGRAPSKMGVGYGLIGMRERVAMYGGTLDAGPRDDGGFAVVARLPLANRR